MGLEEERILEITREILALEEWPSGCVTSRRLLGQTHNVGIGFDSRGKAIGNHQCSWSPLVFEGD